MSVDLTSSVYKVIADFPGSMYRVGDTIGVMSSTGMAYLIGIGDESLKDDVRDYPHLFERVD